MPLYAYRARNSRGDSIKGEIEAASADALATQLINSGSTPIDIKETKAKRDSWGEFQRRLGAGKPELEDLILFCRQMYTLTRSGVPIIRGITGLAETTKNIVLADAMKKILVELESGRELSTAMSLQGQLFSPLIISLVKVGENTGKLDIAFQQLAQYLEMERDTRNRIKAAMRYPTFVVVAIMAAIGIVNVFVIPAFAKVFQGMKMDLPWQTRTLIGLSDFTVAYWPYMLGLIIAAIVGANYYIKTPNGRYRWDRTKLRIPVVGGIINRALLARFSRSFAMASKSGVPLIQGLTVVARAVDNDYVAEKILGMRNGIERGDSLTRTAIATGMFTPLVLQMLSVGEETGAVDEMLDEVADFYEREVDYDLKNLSQAIEPILIIAVGILVLILALGVFLPMWDITQLARR
jgi:MSHA biogenesis protein MshG